jgi:hypothetical protein
MRMIAAGDEAQDDAGGDRREQDEGERVHSRSPRKVSR